MSKEQKREHERAKGGEDTIPWRALVFGLIGASAATIAASKLPSPNWMYSQLTRFEKFTKSETGSKRLTEFREDACKLYERYKRQLRLLAYEDEIDCLGSFVVRSRAKPYTDDEIKVLHIVSASAKFLSSFKSKNILFALLTAFWAKIMECHPDQNQDNKEFAEAKFKTVMTAYKAIMARNDEKSTPI
ncbi:PREDICTED: uncharacterized protein LOC109152761 [Ipomoea nil]|uniref:uncharacterized protein LOC109152761 n=1 Tax=Ipomoea nil TaxID=35883 RepID=UPI00090156B0|nr:PREDICTED: uncharacterized protein LOC109152761 [Ipomoea nil]